MTVHEQFIKGKKENPALCEDGYVVLPHFIAVADGVTSKDGSLFDGKTGGRAAMEKALSAVREFPRDIDADDAFRCINDAIGTLYAAGNSGTASACVMVFSEYRREIWCAGDCQCMINGTLFSHEKEFDRVVSDMRALVLTLSGLEGMSEEELIKRDIGREFILPVLEKEHLLGNSEGEFGFPVLDGKSFRGKGIVKHAVNKGDFVVLASDGYPLLKPSLSESENELIRVIRENPLCKAPYRSTKGVLPGSTSFDDRTYISFTV